MTLLDHWKTQVDNRIKSPWPGPRPMRADRDDPRSLIGRSSDARAFARLVFDTDVVVFTGATGVGKTSMLELDLKPTLWNAGYHVLVCNDWTRDSADIDVDKLLARQLEGSLPPGVRPSEDGSNLMDQLDQLYPNECVLVLDQFEELIRYQPRLYQATLRWIERTAASTQVRIVISLRIEYEHELRGHAGLRLGPFQQARYELGPITDSLSIEGIIESGNRSSEGAIAKAARDRLLEEWGRATEEGSDADVGLLHLQAALLTLWVNKHGSRIEDEDVIKLADATREPFGGVFRGALAGSVEVLLGACRDACSPSVKDDWDGTDPVLAVRAEHYVRAMSSMLSSGGYKVSISRESLAQLALERDGTSELMRSADESPSTPTRGMSPSTWLGTRFASVVDAANSSQHATSLGPESDWLAAPRSTLLSEEPSPDRNTDDNLPWERDPHDLTAGVLLGLRPLDSLTEEYRAFHFAVEWLRASELVRVTTPEPGKTMVSLIHDLFGTGLVQWSNRAVAGSNTVPANEAVQQFTALRGARMRWSQSRHSEALNRGTFINLRWKFCDITATFEGVTFVNCDFQGTTFRRCTFKGVQFVNCTLDDVEFVECRITGSPNLMPESSHFDKEDPRFGTQPSFLISPADVADPESLRSRLKSLSWYAGSREALSQDAALFSFTAGLAARPSRRSDTARGLAFETQAGGVTMLGGRLSSLKIRSCDFGTDGWMSLRQVAGTSVEFAEQTQLRLELFDTAIRGLTITRPVDAGKPTDNNAFTLTLRKSAMVNVWFGVGLTGKAVFDDCMVLEMFNAADQPGADGERTPGFEVTLPNSSNFGVVNSVATPQDLGDLESPEDAKRSLGSMRPIVRRISDKIDYRRFPALFELRAAAITAEPDLGEDA